MEILHKLRLKQGIIALVVIGLIVFFQTFFSAFVGDDQQQIYNLYLVKNFFELPKVFLFHHTVIGSENSLLSGYYKPIMLFYFYSIRLVFGFNPFFYHAPQIILSIVNSCLVFVFFSKFFKRYLALLLSVLFLVHPINQETVVYVSNIQDVLFFIFGMSALILSTQTKLSVKKYLLIFLLLLLSMFSKETGILFSAITLVYVFFFKRNELIKSSLLVLSVILIYIFFRFSSKTTPAFWIEPPPMTRLNTFNRLLHVPYLFFLYIKTFFYPDILSFNQQWVIKKFSFANLLFPLLIDLLVAGALLGSNIYAYSKKFKNAKLLSLFSIWLFLGLIPHFQIVPLDATFATRWFYFSSVGLIGIIGIIFSYLLNRYQKRDGLIILLLILALLTLSTRTIVRNIQWEDAFTLYKNDYKNSESALLENNLGDEYFKRGDTDNARKYFEDSLRIDPTLWIAINNLGIIEEKKGNLTNALYYYRKAEKIGDRLPIVENISRVLVLQGKNKEAITYIKKGLGKYPLSAKLWLTNALAHYELKEYKAALSDAEKSYSFLPDEQTLAVIKAISERIK